jgi:acyl carrier protein
MEQGISEVIAGIQRLIVETLELDTQPGDLDPDLAFADLEVTRDGETATIDSVDVVDVVVALEDRLEFELLEDDDFRRSAGSIRKIADFLVSRRGSAAVSRLTESGD